MNQHQTENLIKYRINNAVIFEPLTDIIGVIRTKKNWIFYDQFSRQWYWLENVFW